MSNWSACVCGGVIVVHRGDNLEDVVARHNDEPRHLKWVIAQLQAELDVYAKTRPNLSREGKVYE